MSRLGRPIPLPDPELADGDLVLRPWSRPDAAALVQGWADDEVARWTGVPPRPDLATATRWIAGDVDRRARGLSLDLALDLDGETAGEVGLAGFDAARRTAEIGWWVGPAHRGVGLATRAARLLAGWAVEELCIDVVLARCAAANPGSGRVADRAGFDLLDRGDGTEVWCFGGATGATLGT